MPLRRFAGYFFGISVCSTLAFAPGVLVRSAPQTGEPPPDAPAGRAVVKRLAPAASHARAPRRMTLVASAG